MTPARDDEPHPLEGRWQPARPFVWGGHVSPGFVRLLLLSHAVALAWFVSDWDHIRLILYDFHEVRSEEFVNATPDELGARYPYIEDPVDQLRPYRVIAEPIVAGATDATKRAQRLADYIYSLRSGSGDIFDEDVRYGPDVLLDRMREGLEANCGQMSTVLATFWRSLGGHSRAVRWATHRGLIGHYALELWDPERQRWFYYDMNLNGYAYDDDGSTPLSVATLRASLLTGEDLHVTMNPHAQDFTLAALVRTVREFPVESYVLNNDFLRWSPKKRFGLLNRYYPALAALPHPWDRILDNLTGGRDSRLVVRGRLLVAGLFSFSGGRVFLSYLLIVIAVCTLTLRRIPSVPRASTIPPTAPDTPPSR